MVRNINLESKNVKLVENFKILTRTTCITCNSKNITPDLS